MGRPDFGSKQGWLAGLGHLPWYPQRRHSPWIRLNLFTSQINILRLSKTPWTEIMTTLRLIATRQLMKHWMPIRSFAQVPVSRYLNSLKGNKHCQKYLNFHLSTTSPRTRSPEKQRKALHLNGSHLYFACDPWEIREIHKHLSLGQCGKSILQRNKGINFGSINHGWFSGDAKETFYLSLSLE